MASGSDAAGTPRVFGHRGAAGLAPENTVPSFALALALGADVLELDVHGSRDGVVVVAHDAMLERTTDGCGDVRDWDWRDLCGLDAGYHFTTTGDDFPFRGQGVRLASLRMVLRSFPVAPLNIEIKQEEPPIVRAVLRLIEEFGAQDRVLLAAERDVVMEQIRHCGRSIRTGFSAAEVADFFTRLRTATWDDYRPAGRALQIPARLGSFPLVTGDSVAAAHRQGLEVHVWTVNQGAEMERLLDAGVDGIMSDLPGMARTVVDAWCRRRPCAERARRGAEHQ